MKLTVTKIRAAAAGTLLQDGSGLMLKRTATGGRWVFRYQFSGRRRDMGLGSWPGVSLADARAQRTRWRQVLQAYRDPIAERQKLLHEERIKAATDPTLEELVDLIFASLSEKLRPSTRAAWREGIRRHILPKLGKRRASTLNQIDLRDVLQPIWRTKTATAQSVLSRLTIVFRNGKLMGFSVDPETCSAARLMLGHVELVNKPHPSTPWRSIPTLYARLDKGFVSHLALRWLILTLVRSESGRGARFDEIEGNIWTVPASRMKATKSSAKAFRVPLTGPALEIVAACRDLAGHSPYLFASPRGAAAGFIHTVSIRAALDVLNEPGRPHGFRSSFRSWVQDTDAASWDVAETALAHAIGGQVERTYARSDLLERRRHLMEAWARHVTGGGSNVRQLVSV